MGINDDGMSMEEHAMLWWIEKGYTIPSPDSIEWEEMYAEWVDFAFKGI